MDSSNDRIERSAMALSRVEQNYPALTRLTVSNLGDTGSYWPNDSADLARLGDAVGNNTNLRSLAICSAPELADMAANNGAFFDGIKRNDFICWLSLTHCDLTVGMGREILNEFVANNSNLVSIWLTRCAIWSGGTAVLTSAVTSCTNLKSIWLDSCNIDDDILIEIVSGTRGLLHQLRALDLAGNNFGSAGCEALASLLKDPTWNLHNLDLGSNNRIDDNCSTILVNALKVNRKLLRLGLSGSAITESGWDALSQVLCNTSSVNDTYLSNHTLNNLGNADLPINLSALLELNSGVDKKQVAIRKILRHHAHLDMEPFLEWDLKVLPLAVSWFDRARHSVPENSGASVDTKKLSAIYQFSKALPMMFVPPQRKATNKRKISKALSSIYQFARVVPLMFVPSHHNSSAGRKIGDSN